jgi:hypothetical protein
MYAERVTLMAHDSISHQKTTQHIVAQGSQHLARNKLNLELPVQSTAVSTILHYEWQDLQARSCSLALVKQQRNCMPAWAYLTLYMATPSWQACTYQPTHTWPMGE